MSRSVAMKRCARTSLRSRRLRRSRHGSVTHHRLWSRWSATSRRRLMSSSLSAARARGSRRPKWRPVMRYCGCGGPVTRSPRSPRGSRQLRRRRNDPGGGGCWSVAELRPTRLMRWPEQPVRLDSDYAGALLLVPALVALDLPGAVAGAGLPGTREVPALCSVLSLLALKSIGRRRVSHVDDVCVDPALALFAGLEGLPHAGSLGSYSYRCDTRSHATSEKRKIGGSANVESVIPGPYSTACPHPDVRRRFRPVGFGARGKAQGRPFHPGVTGKGKPGRVKNLNLRLMPRHVDPRWWDAGTGSKDWPLGSGRRRLGMVPSRDEYRRPRGTGGTHPGRISCAWNVVTPVGVRCCSAGKPTARKAQSPGGNLALSASMWSGFGF